MTAYKRMKHNKMFDFVLLERKLTIKKVKIEDDSNNYI